MDGYIRLMKFLSPKCRGNHVVLPLFLLGPLHMIVSLTINAAQFDSVLKSLDQN